MHGVEEGVASISDVGFVAIDLCREIISAGFIRMISLDMAVIPLRVNSVMMERKIIHARLCLVDGSSIVINGATSSKYIGICYVIGRNHEFPRL